MRRACIDIGSNTTRLLVADCSDGDLHECHQERAFTQIGRSLDADGTISEAKLAEVVSTVSSQLEIARELGAEQVWCVATAGVRRASNAERLVELIAGACDGLETRILTGAQEARLAFIGAAWATGEGTGTLAVVDAGGGSCELAVGDLPEDVRWWASLPVGSGDITVAWLKSDPPSAAELGQARDHLRASFEALRPPPAERVIAVGGSATSLRTLAGPRLDERAFSRLLALVTGCRADELARRFGVDVRRARLLPGGLVILEAVSELFRMPLELGGGGLREGLLLSPGGYQ